jgi:hypothetical protein
MILSRKEANDLVRRVLITPKTYRPNAKSLVFANSLVDMEHLPIFGLKRQSEASTHHTHAIHGID